MELGPNTKSALREQPLVQRQSGTLKNGTANHVDGNISVELRGDGDHVGRTRVDFSTVCDAGSCTTVYTGFSGDGFWNPIAPAGFGDGIGGSWEIPGGNGFITNRICGQKRMDVGLNMIYYLLFYFVVFMVFLVFGRALSTQWTSLKISFFSFSTSVLILLAWNLAISRLFFEKSLNDGVSVLFSSMLSVVVLFLCSVLFCIALHVFRCVMRQ